MLHGKVGWQTCAALKTDLCYNVYAPTGTLEDPRIGIDNIKPWCKWASHGQLPRRESRNDAVRWKNVGMETTCR